MTKSVLYEVTGAVAVITLNRPERMNALDAAVFAALLAAFDQAEAEAAVRAVMLIGTGRAFCAGADLMQALGGQAAGAADLGAEIDRTYNRLTRRMRDCPKPILAAVNGAAAGAGMNLALAADVVVAASSATFTQAFVRIGLMPDAGGTYFLPRLVGSGQARALAMLGETLSAAQARDIGLVWAVFADEVFPAEALAMAANLAARPAAAMAAMKQAFAASETNGLDAQLDLERDLQRALGYTADFAEGVAAFLEKRPAVFNRPNSVA